MKGESLQTATELRTLDRWLSACLQGAESAPEGPRAERLLEFARQELPSLERSPLADPGFASELAAILTDTGDLGPGTLIGPFQIERAIGAGGMGAVYLARRVDGGFEQKVALKVLIGARPAPESFRQFEREREMLARLEHPGIARLIDGGMTQDLRPWFAMEYVEGEPIDRYADHKRLGVEARLELFMQVCRALEYAHSRLVLHRDIKPSNVLVTADSTVKLLDFGLGRIDERLDRADATVTQLSARWLTPEYASPEQVRGEAITVGSEVYQLGMLLYRLLCNELPFRLADTNPATLVSTICETSPGRPSAHWLGVDRSSTDATAECFGATPGALARRLRGDLDNIVLTALAKRPERRYGNVGELVEDLQRHFDHRPVRARAGTRRYRLGKFLRRYRYPVATAASVFFLISTALGVISMQAGDLAVERDKALVSAERNARLTGVLTDMVEISDPEEGIEQIITVGERLSQYLDHVRTELAGEPELQIPLMQVIGDTFLELSAFPEAADALGEAHTLSQHAHGAEADTTLELQIRLALALGRIGDVDRAEALFNQVEPIYRARHGDTSEQLAELLFCRGYILSTTTRPNDPRRDQAQADLEEALAIRRRLHDGPHVETAKVMHYLGRHLPDREAGLELIRQGIEMLEAASERPVATAHRKGDLALWLDSLGRHEEALTIGREAWKAHRDAYGETHPESLILHRNVAGYLREVGEFEEAAAIYREALREDNPLADEDGPSRAFAAHGLAIALQGMGEMDEAETWFREAVRLTALHRMNAEPRARRSLARNLAGQGRFEEAVEQYRSAVTLFTDYSGQEAAATLETIQEWQSLDTDFAAESSR